jgi:hypothetical protein
MPMQSQSHMIPPRSGGQLYQPRPSMGYGSPQQSMSMPMPVGMNGMGMNMGLGMNSVRVPAPPAAYAPAYSAAMNVGLRPTTMYAPSALRQSFGNPAMALNPYVPGPSLGPNFGPR